MFYLINKKSEKLIGTLLFGSAATILVGTIVISIF